MLKKELIILIPVFILFTLTGTLDAKIIDYSIPPEIRNQAKVEELIQKAIYFYWNGGDIGAAQKKYFKGITLRGKLAVVEQSFDQAAELAPNRLDLKFDVASTEILQGKLDNALDTYLSILKLDPVNFNASILYAVYCKINGNLDIYNETINNLEMIYPKKVKQYVETIDRTDEILKTKLVVKPEKMNLKNYVIVILGYALAEDGTARPILVKRLEQGLALYRLNPEAKIIVSGGMAHGGLTQSYVMKRWLMQHKVPADIIYIEDRAKDTVGNAIYSVDILQKLNAKNVTLTTSASHMRRALAVFQEACIRDGLNIEFSNLAYLDYPHLTNAMVVSKNEELVVFRDLMRSCGIWAYPGIQQ